MFNLPDSILIGARLDAVVKEIAAAGGPIRFIYVERRGDTYRWSPAHRGGAYPLLRETAMYLGTDCHRIILPFRALLDTGLTIIKPEPDYPTHPDSWTVLEFHSPKPANEVRARVRAAHDRARSCRGRLPDPGSPGRRGRTGLPRGLGDGHIRGGVPVARRNRPGSISR